MSPGDERREFLKQYILGCVRSSVLSWTDLTSPDVLNKFLKVLSKDVKIVLKGLSRETGVGLLHMGVSMLGGMLASAGRKR